MKSMHIPLPTEWYQRLQILAKQMGISTTETVRKAVESYLQEQEKKRVHDAITQFAEEFGGSPEDLDYSLEAEGVKTISHTDYEKR